MQALRTWLESGVPIWAVDLATSNTALVSAALSFLLIAFVSCRIFAKAGYPAWVGVFIFVPVLNAVLFIGLALLRWPVERELKSLRRVEQGVRRTGPRHLRRVS